AQGVLNWLFTKQVFSSNLDRDHRPYRRRPEPDRYSYSPWWGSATTATTIASSLLIGPLAHIHSDLDLRLDDNSEKAIADLDHHPDLGAAGEYFVADFVNIADTTYRLPETLRSWAADRFTDDEADRTTYLQAFVHHTSTADDPHLFRQSNGGAEVVSGNRN